MELKEAILGRHSVRGFLEQPVEKETLCELLALADRAVSADNSQPWKYAIVSGELLKKIADENEQAFLDGAQPDYPDQVLSGVYKERSREIGKALLTAAGIAREDKEKRMWWAARGYRFFDAPALILLYMDEQLDESYYRLSCGAVVQNICLAAFSCGLATCVEDQAITYQRAWKRYGVLPEGARAVVGIAIGYEDRAFAANAVVTPRVSVDELVTWHA